MADERKPLLTPEAVELRNLSDKNMKSENTETDQDIIKCVDHFYKTLQGIFGNTKGQIHSFFDRFRSWDSLLEEKIDKFNSGLEVVTFQRLMENNKEKLNPNTEQKLIDLLSMINTVRGYLNNKADHYDPKHYFQNSQQFKAYTQRIESAIDDYLKKYPKPGYKAPVIQITKSDESATTIKHERKR